MSDDSDDSLSLDEALAVDRAVDAYERAFRDAARDRQPSPVLDALLADLSELAAATVRARYPRHHPPAIPGYRLIDEIDRGGMGVVYRAFQAGTGDVFAVKVLDSGELARAERLRILFEGKVLECLKHPNIVPILEFAEFDGGAFLVMPYIPGPNLAKQMANWSARPDHCPAERVADRKKAIAAFVEKLARAVAHVHLRLIMHRDLKPANVLIDLDGEPRICDFGLARRTDDALITLDGEFAGTLKYMAPEQRAGRPDLTLAVDLYSLGAILYEMLTGHPPFCGPGESLERKLTAKLPPHPFTHNAQLEPDGDLEWIAMECLYLNPAGGWRNAEELADALRNFADGKPVRAPEPRSPWWVRVGLPFAGEIRQPDYVLRWFQPLRIEAVTVTLAHVGMFLLLSKHAPGWALGLWLLATDTCLGWFIWIAAQRRQRFRLTALEWDVMHLWAAATVGEVLLFALHCPLFSPADPHEVVRFYSTWAVMRAVLFFVEGHLFWPRLRLVSFAYVLVAVVLPWLGLGAALVYGGLTGGCFLWLSFQSKEPATSPPHSSA